MTPETSTDLAVGIPAITSLGWIDYVHAGNEVAAFALTLGGIVLVGLRVYYLIKDRKKDG